MNAENRTKIIFLRGIKIDNFSTFKLNIYLNNNLDIYKTPINRILFGLKYLKILLSNFGR